MSSVQDPKHRFESRWNSARRIVHGYFRRLGLSAELAEDLTQDVAERIARRYSELHFESEPHWLAYLMRVANSVKANYFRDGARLESSSDLSLIECVPDQAVTESALIELIELSQRRKAADAVWLGPEPTGLAVWLLLAQLLFVDGRPMAQVFNVATALLGTNVPGSEPELLERLDHIRVLRSLAFQKIGVVEAVPKNAQRTLPLAEYNVRSMEELWATTRVCRSRSQAYGNPCLWKRLAFEHIPQGMSHDQFLDLYSPAADVCGYNLTKVTLHAWISNKRIFRELDSHCCA